MGHESPTLDEKYHQQRSLHYQRKNFVSIFGHALVYSSLLITVAAITVDTQITVLTSVETEDELEHAQNDLKRFLLIAVISLLGTSFLMLEGHGLEGLLVYLLISVPVLIWLYRGHNQVLKKIEKKLARKHEN